MTDGFETDVAGNLEAACASHSEGVCEVGLRARDLSRLVNGPDCYNAVHGPYWPITNRPRIRTDPRRAPWPRRLPPFRPRTSLDGGRGYIEKDWGRGFPSAYVWTQSNHFDRPGVCLTASVARIPWLGTSFRGFLAGLLLAGTLHRFTTYTGARVERCEVTETHARVVFADRQVRLSVDAERGEGALLRAPYERLMLERVAAVARLARRRR